MMQDRDEYAAMTVTEKTVERVGSDECTMVVKYETPSNSNGSNTQELDVVYWDTDISLQTQHITAVSDQANRTTVPEGVPGVEVTNLSIGRNGDRVDGVDILVPATELTARVLRTRGFWSTSYERIVAEMASKVNLKKFRGWNPGEVMFLGAQKSDSGSNYFNITYKFRVEPNKTMTSKEISSIVVSNTTSDSLTKQGHDYLWFEHGQFYDTGEDETREGIIAVHVDKVYESADFKALKVD